MYQEFIFHLHILKPELTSNKKYEVKLLRQSFQICQNEVEDEKTLLTDLHLCETLHPIEKNNITDWTHNY